MDKYISISKIIPRITDDEVLRAFFTVYLFEEDEVKRDALDDEFHASIEALPKAEREIMRKKIAASFKKFPLAVADWGNDVDAFIAKYQPKIAA